MLEPSRRTVLGTGLGLLGLAVIGAGQLPADAATAPGPVRHDYTGSVGRAFTVHHRGRSHRLTLRAIQDLPHARAAHHRYCFSLLFAPGGRTVLSDGIYTLRRAGVPTHSLFLARIGTGRTLQAVVNRAH